MSKGNIIFVHGSLHGAWCWDNFEKFFSMNDYAVFSVDFQCQGKKRVVMDDYVKILNKEIDKIGDNIILVAHSMGSNIVLKTLGMKRDKIDKIILLSPLPIKNVLTSMMIVGLHMIIKSKEEVFFSSDKIDDISKDKYIKKLRKDPLIPQLQVLKGVKLEKNINFFPILVITSWNDKCIPAKCCINTGKNLKAKTVVFNNVCHDMMLDEDWLLVAKEIYKFITGE